MATLLASGQFYAEALPPAAEALTLGLKALEALKMALPHEVVELKEQLARSVGEENIQPLLQSAKESLESIEEGLTQYSLS